MDDSDLETLKDDKKDEIKKSLPMLVKCLRVDTLLLAHLYTEKIIAKRDYEMLKCYPTDEEQVRYLIQNVILRGPCWKYKKLEDVLVTTKNEHVVEALHGKFNETASPMIRRSPEESRLLNDEEKRSINENRPLLVQCISPHCGLFAYLQQEHVLTTSQKNSSSRAWSEENVREILQVILKGPKWKYDAFLDILDKCGMGFLVVRILNGPENISSALPSASGETVDHAMLTEDEKNTIMDNLPRLVRSLSLSTMMLAYLQQQKIISIEDKNRLRKNKSRSSQVLELLLLILRKPKRFLTAFNDVLEKCDMGHLKIKSNAAQPHAARPWDRQSPTGLQMLLPEKVQILKENLPQLQDRIHLSDIFWAYLLHYRVVGITKREEIQGESPKPPWMQIANLVGVIIRSPIFVYHGFLKSLVESTMDHIVTLLGENPIDYK